MQIILDRDIADRRPRPWTRTRWFALALILIAAVPLLYPSVPPLVDLPGHMGRYRVELDLGTSPWLPHYFGFHWAAIGNLGVDLLVLPLGKLIGLEPAVKLIVLVIPPLTVAGFLWVAKEVHHRLPPTALFALPFAYGHPFLFGFVNFSLSMAMALLAFGLWLHLAHRRAFKLRAVLFVPISLIVFFTHTFGWGTLGLLCFSAEAVRQHDHGSGWFKAGWRAALQALVMALPGLVMLDWRSETHGGMTLGWFDWDLKMRWVEFALRDRWKIFDQVSLGIVAALLLYALVSRRLTFSRNLVFSALVLLGAFIVMPWQVFGSAFADMRLMPFIIAVAVLAIRPRDDRPIRAFSALAIAGLGFFLVRMAATTASLAIAANDQSAKLQALEHVPMGARVATLVGYPCGIEWPLARNSHLGGMVIVRRDGFSNDQWVIEGANLLQLRYPFAGPFSADPSQLVRSNRCRHPWTIDHAMSRLPRKAFDYLWLIDTPPFDQKLTAGMEPVWRGSGSILYRLNP